MNKKLCRTLAGALSIIFVGQTLPSMRSLAKEDVQETASYSTQADIIYASDLTIHGYVQKGTIGDFSVMDNELAYVRIFNGDWAEIASAGVADDGSYSVTATGSDVYHVKFECNGYLPFYLKDFGTGSYLVGSGDSVDTVTLIPGDTTYNADNDNQWSDDVLNADDLAYVQSCIGATSYVATDFNLSMDLNDDGIITQEELDEFCNFYTSLDDGTYYDLSDESCDIDCFDVNNDGIINRYDYYLLYDMVYNEASPEIVNIPDLTGDGYFGYEDLQPFWDRINEAADSNKWIWIYNHDMNRDSIVDANDYIPDSLNYYANPPLPSENYHLYMDKNGNGCIDESDAAWFQSAYEQYGDMEWDHAFKRTLTMDANGKFNWSLNLHDTNLNLNGCALYVGESMSFTTDIPSFWSDGEGAELNINSGRLETGNNLVFRTASPDGWDGITGQNMYLNDGSVVIGGDFNFGQADCYDTIWMTNDSDYLEINHNWNYITLTDMEGKWTAGLINFQGPTWEVNEASGEKSVYSSGTHAIRFYYPDGKQTILWDNPNEYINAEDGTPNTLRTFNFDYIDPETGECLGLIFPNGYSDELYWFRPWFDVFEWIPIYEWINYPDADGDGLPDKVENYMGTDPLKKDTDGDGLTDYDELFETFTDPTLYDTDNNGINDGQEDFDNDNLSNIDEIENRTDCYDEDTDNDSLIDGDEVKIYHSDPLKADTDGDTLIDGDDVALGFDPTLPDTDFNGILDCDEKIRQTLTLNVDDDSNPIEFVSVSFEGTGNINSNTSINDIMGKDVLCSNVVGLVGNPYDLNSTSQFNEAELTFKIRKNSLGDNQFDDLAILWYNEDTQKFELIDCTLDSTNSTVKANLPHFSKYMIVNRRIWTEAWKQSLDYTEDKPFDMVLAIDCSGSMEDLDPEPNSNGIASKRHMAASSFINTMKDKDETAIIGFSTYAEWLCDFTDDKSKLNSSLYSLYQEGSTNFNPVLSESISKLKNRVESVEEDSGKMIILLSDGGMLEDLVEELNEELLKDAKKSNIKIYTIGVGAEVDEAILTHIAEATGGDYYYALTMDELSDLYIEIGKAKAKEIDMTDFDEDGLPDIFEVVGMQLQDGTIIHTDPTTKYSDKDSLTDGEEIVAHYNEKDGTVTFTMNSNPKLEDTDGDGLWDDCDPNPLDSCNNGDILGILSAESLAKIESAYSKMDDLGYENNQFTSFTDQSLQYTREYITYLQKGLEYLGYLDMGDAYYGRFGGATRSAVMLYQLNHRLYNEGQLDNHGVDKTTFYSIIKSAIDAGLKYDDMFLEGSVQNYFKNNYTPISIPMDSSEYPVVESERSNKFETIYVYDFTASLNQFLKYGANEFHTHYFLCNADVSDNKNPFIPLAITIQIPKITRQYDNSSEKCISYRNAISDYSWLIKKVKNEGLYNIKLEKHWNQMCKNTNTDMPFYHSALPFVFNEDEINAEIFGNILYGYIGNAGGFSELELVGGGSVYSIIDSGKPDNSEDTSMIKKGFQMYNEVKRNYIYVHSEIYVDTL